MTISDATLNLLSKASFCVKLSNPFVNTLKYRKRQLFIFIQNKKVLLRERKRHTARRVVSTPSVVLPGYPPPPGGGYLTWVPPPGGGVPDPCTPPGGGVPEPPPGGTRSGGIPDLGTPPQRGGVWVPPPASWHSGKCCKALWDMGTPPLWTDRLMDGQTRVKTLPSLVLRTRAVNIAHSNMAYSACHQCNCDAKYISCEIVVAKINRLPLTLTFTYLANISSSPTAKLCTVLSSLA